MAQFTNQATLSYRSSVTNSNVAIGELLQTVSAAKTAIQNDYVAGDEITYVVNLVNAGEVAATGLTVTDDLGEYAFGDTTLTPLEYVADSVHYFVNGALQPTPAVSTVDGLAVSGISVPAGGNAAILYTARVNQYAPLGVDDTITNTATVTGDGVCTTIEASMTIATGNVPTLTIAKSISPVPVTENGALTYTFIVQNAGNTAAEADDNVVISDLFDPMLTNITVTLNGTPLASPAGYTYDEGTGEFATAAGAVTVPAATFAQNEDTGVWVTTPGYSTLVVSGTVCGTVQEEINR